MTEYNTDVGGRNVYYEYENEYQREALEHLRGLSDEDRDKIFNSSVPTFDFRCSDGYRHYFNVAYGGSGAATWWTLTEVEG